MTNLRRLSTVLLTLVCFAAFVAGCAATEEASGSEISSAVKKKFKSQLAKQDLTIKTVKCPKTVSLKKGKVTTCTVTYTTGDEQDLTVTGKGDGKYRAELVKGPNMIDVEALNAAAADYLADQGDEISVDCPETELSEDEDTVVTCDADIDGTVTPIDATVSSDGSITDISASGGGEEESTDDSGEMTEEGTEEETTEEVPAE